MSEAPQARVELLAARYLRILGRFGNLVDEDPTLDERDEVVHIPIPQPITDEVWDGLPDPPPQFVATLSAGIGSPRRPPMVTLRYECGLPCGVCRDTAWVVRGGRVRCGVCERVKQRVRDSGRAVSANTRRRALYAKRRAAAK